MRPNAADGVQCYSRQMVWDFGLLPIDSSDFLTTSVSSHVIADCTLSVMLGSTMVTRDYLSSPITNPRIRPCLAQRLSENHNNLDRIIRPRQKHGRNPPIQ